MELKEMEHFKAQINKEALEDQADKEATVVTTTHLTWAGRSERHETTADFFFRTSHS